MHNDILRNLCWNYSASSEFLNLIFFSLRRNPITIPQNINAVDQRDREVSFYAEWSKKHLEKKSKNFFYGEYGDIRCSPEQSVKSPMMLSSPNRCPEGASFSSHASTEIATQRGNSDCQWAGVPGVQSIHEPIPDGRGHIKSQSTEPSMSISQKLKSLPGCADLESSPKKAKDSLTNIFPILPSMWNVYC